jgi:hypothetical protein
VAVITTIGSAGAGAIWGWLLGMTDGNIRRPFRTFATLIFATIVVIAEVDVLTSKEQLVAFGAAALAALLLHIGWRRYMRLHTQ